MVWPPYERWLLWIYLIFVLGLPHRALQASIFGERTLPQLSTDQISALVSTPDPVVNVDPSNPNSHISKILIPRSPDTDNNTLVKNYIVSTMRALQWHVEEDAFTDNTPYGPKRFVNVIATKDPTASRRVILSAHFDSKFFPSYPQNQFVGATDSAAPCAMLLDLAEALDPLLDLRRERLESGVDEDEDISDITLQLVFFDGEEAFRDWTATDSTYGSRHLAEKWADTYLSPNTKRRMMTSYSATEIDTIEHLILLDLLGAPNPRISSYFLDTGWLFDAMVSSESRLGQIGVLQYGADSSPVSSFFVPRVGAGVNLGGIEDDHLPFLRRGVTVLHIIPTPFPQVWHSLRDDASALHIPTMRQWNLILRIFMAEYLHLRPDIDNLPSARESASSVRRSDSDL